MLSVTTDHEKTSLSVRIPTRLKSRAVSVAHAQHVSFNTFVTALIEKEVREAEQRALYDAFTELGDDPEAPEVEFALPAQAEVALRD